jgi:CheY-like chemotaxis protein
VKQVRPSYTKQPSGLPRAVVLYVEDEAPNREVATFRLRDRCELYCADSSRSACALVRQLGGRLNAVLMDIQLRGSDLDGIALTKLIRGGLRPKDRPPYAAGMPIVTVPIFFMTAYGDRYSEKELLDAGGTQVLHKPVDFVALMGAMARAAVANL